MKGNRIHQASLAALVALAGTGAGCVTPHQSAASDVDPTEWSTPAEVVFPNTDTLSSRDIMLFLRCNERFEEDTLTVRIATVTPDSLRCVELVPLRISRTRTPAALTFETAIPYRRAVRLERTGDYRFFITPNRPVQGVEAVGIHLTDND